MAKNSTWAELQRKNGGRRSLRHIKNPLCCYRAAFRRHNAPRNRFQSTQRYYNSLCIKQLVIDFVFVLNKSILCMRFINLFSLWCLWCWMLGRIISPIFRVHRASLVVLCENCLFHQVLKRLVSKNWKPDLLLNITEFCLTFQIGCLIFTTYSLLGGDRKPLLSFIFLTKNSIIFPEWMDDSVLWTNSIDGNFSRL